MEPEKLPAIEGEDGDQQEIFAVLCALLLISLMLLAILLGASNSQDANKDQSLTASRKEKINQLEQVKQRKENLKKETSKLISELHDLALTIEKQRRHWPILQQRLVIDELNQLADKYILLISYLKSAMTEIRGENVSAAQRYLQQSQQLIDEVSQEQQKLKRIIKFLEKAPEAKPESNNKSQPDAKPVARQNFWRVLSSVKILLF